jgi:hypothetical protein
MSALIDMFEARSLTNAINRAKVIEPFVLNTFFKATQYHAADKIDIEIISGSDKLAQFVNQHEGALPIKKLSKVVKTLSLPRTFEKKIFTALELANYKSIGNIYVTSPDDRTRIANQMILQELEELKSRIIRRREQMACEALSTGKVIVSQDNIDFSVDFEYQSNVQLVTLGSTAKWSETTSKPLVNLRNWRRDIMKRCGINADILILGSDASDAFVSNDSVKKELDTINNRVGVMDLTQNPTRTGMFIGRIMGVDIYEYNQQYTKPDETTADMIDPKKAIMVASQSPGFRVHYGPIYRIESGNLKIYQNELLVETNTNVDKTALDWKVEQKSLPTIHEPNAIISATVV